MKNHIAVYQGTFDPFTSGHLAVLKDALAVFDEVIVLLLVNPAKKPLFSVQERKDMIAASVADLPGARVDSYGGLLADYMQARGLRVCVRGVRNGADFAFELESHRLSRAFYPALQTVFLPCAPQWEALSSSALKAACARGRAPRAWAPAPVIKKLEEKYPGLSVF